MTWFFWKKKKESSPLDLEVVKRIEGESKKLGKEQVLFATIKRNNNGRGEVLVGFQDKTPLEKGLIRFETKEVELQLEKGEFKLHEGKLYFYPNIDIQWHPTPNPTIHKIVSNYDFSNKEIYLEPKDFQYLQEELSKSFHKEGIQSAYMNGKVCQLEIRELDSERELRLSDSLLNFLSCFYPSPFSKSQNHP